MKIRITLFLMLLGILILPSCLPDFNLDGEDLDDWNPNFAIPLLNTNLTLQDALDNFDTGGLISTNSDNLITVVYRGSRFSIFGGSFFNLPDFQVPFLDTIQDNPVPLPSPTEFKNITLKGGTYTYGASSLETQALNVTVTIPDLTIAGLAFVRQFIIPASDGVTPVEFTDTVNLTDFNLSFEGGDFRTEYKAIGTSNGQSVVIPSSYFEMYDLEYSYIDGYFGNQTLNLPAGSNTIDLFKNWQQGNITFEDPKFTFNFRNSYGCPIRVNVDSMSVETNFNGTVNLQSNALDNGIDLNFPSLAQIGGISTTSLTLNATNSNINDLLSNIPFEFFYNLDAKVNPDANPAIQNFLTDSSKLEVDVDMELPMYASIGEFVLKDTFDFDFSEYEDLERITFRLLTDNGFPFDVGMQVYFLNDQNETLDSLFSTNSPVFAAASVDASGNVTSSVETITEESFDNLRFSNLTANGTKLVIIGSLQTVDGGTTPVKIYSDYNVSIKLGALGGI
jgi:hypothetical protein